MRRYRYLISLLVLVASLAQQGPVAAQAVVPAHPNFGKRTADPRNFGAKIDGTTDDTLAWQKALDSLNANAPGPGSQNTLVGRVLVPSGTSLITSPIFYDVSNVEFVGEGQSVSRILGGEGGAGVAFPLFLWGVKRVTNWQDDPFNLPPSPIFSQAGIPTVFDASGAATKYLHRLPCTGNTLPIGSLDSSMAGRFAIKSRPTANFDGTYTNPIPPDHHVIFVDNPFQCGPKDNWMTTQKLCVQAAFQYQPNTAMPAGLMFFGHGDIIDGGNGMGTFGLITDTSSPPRFAFKFQTNEFPGFDRVIYFGDTTQTGVQRLCVQVDLTANDGSGRCKIYASQNGQQVAVTPGQGTQSALSLQHPIISNSTGGTYAVTMINPLTHAQTTITVASTATAASLQAQMDTFFGAGNTVVTVAGFAWNNWIVQFQGALTSVNVPLFTFDTTGTTGTGVAAQLTYEYGFSAALGLHLKKNDVYPFGIFGDPQNYQFTTHRPLSDLICFGLMISNDWVYSDQSGNVGGLPQPESRIDGRTQADVWRYLDNVSASTIVGLRLDDQINEPTRNSNKLVKAFHGTAGAGLGSFGLFVPYDVTICDQFNTVNNQAIRNLQLESTGNWGTCAFATTPIATQIDTCNLFGGWTGVTLMSYDWRMTGQCHVYGGHAWINLVQGAMYVEHLARAPVGHHAIFLSGGNFECHQLFSADMNSFGGMKTRSLVRQDGTMNYGNRLHLENIESDNEVTFPQDLQALIDVDYVNETVTPNAVTISRVSTGGIANKPVLKLNNGSLAGPTNLDAVMNSIVTLSDIYSADGFLVQADDPSWDIYFQDKMAWWPLREVYRNVGVGKDNSLHYEYTPYSFPTDPNATPPFAGRWVKGMSVNVRNPAPGAVARWTVTTSGTGAWSSTHPYYRYEIVQHGGAEYIAANDNPPVGDTPPSTHWIATTDGYGSATAPVFKAVSTVAP